MKFVFRTNFFKNKFYLKFKIHFLNEISLHPFYLTNYNYNYYETSLKKNWNIRAAPPFNIPSVLCTYLFISLTVELLRFCCNNQQNIYTLQHYFFQQTIQIIRYFG